MFYILPSVQNMTNDASLENSYVLLLESAKNCQFAIIDFFGKIQLYSKNVQKMINYTFFKSPYPCHFKYAKSFAEF